jgi:hypothetical protein
LEFGWFDVLGDVIEPKGLAWSLVRWTLLAMWVKVLGESDVGFSEMLQFPLGWLPAEAGGSITTRLFWTILSVLTPSSESDSPQY